MATNTIVFKDDLKQAFFPASSSVLTCRMHRDAEEESKILKIEPLLQSLCKTCLFYLLCLISGGLLFLLQWWFLKLHLKLRYSRVNPSEASHLLIVTQYSSIVTPTQIKHIGNGESMLTFEFHHLPYYITRTEVLPLYMETELDYKTMVDKYEAGLSSDVEITKRETLYGKCQILVDVKSFPVLVMEEFLNPFFVFQVFSVALWMYDDYVFYACVILGTSLTSLVISVFETRKNLKTIRTMAYYETPLNVLRGGDMQKMSSTELVPGDVIEIPDNCKMPCDAAIISGSAIMDEAMLTGESIPVLKDPLPYISSSHYNIDLDKLHTLYEGTFVIQTRNAGSSKSLGIVCRTGYMTMK